MTVVDNLVYVHDSANVELLDCNINDTIVLKEHVCGYLKS